MLLSPPLVRSSSLTFIPVHSKRLRNSELLLQQHTRNLELSPSFSAFNVRSDETDDVDVEGVELPSLHHAEREALESAKEMAAELILRGQVIAGRRFESTDEDEMSSQ